MLFKSLNQLLSSSPSLIKSTGLINKQSESSGLYELNETVGTNKHYNAAVFTRPQMYSF
ncbi:hypothetical protein DDB_G0275233 [Dictyostelium discoideum AX4]|uniref:Uncharacterized protein n=1 Tax=Dictyostelium discoideum TaxID=44689 RepID=Q8T2R2_DICDI|nr:hypothetical protein DDB_G0275233 [Dictyostelium discoideum AX4]EAL69897.1 hypothetical protein DDB_G0275233 [Dictyostelium discoideum AX4]|eukprot:XP_643713.1 hypothetical protein DDB_G0275233 [Dictyostelium discoideum AX4]